MFTQAGNTVFTYTSDIRGITRNHIRILKSMIPESLAAYKSSDKVFSFANGSVLKLGYMDSENDVLRYQGQEYDIIALDGSDAAHRIPISDAKGLFTRCERFSENGCI